MNIRKATDYSEMFIALDTAMAAGLPQMELYVAIGCLVSARREKGAAVIAAEYLAERYPDISGFSPRNLRRMREFCRTYESDQEVLAEAMTIGWTQNVVILEADLTLQERMWYIQAAGQFRWSKLELQRKIAANAHQEIALDFTDDVCYTEEKSTHVESTADDELLLYLPQPDGQVSHESLGEKSGAGEAISHQIRSQQYREDWQSCLPIGPLQTGRAWNRLWRGNSLADHQRRLQQVRPSDWEESGQPTEYDAPHLRRRSQWQDALADGVYRPSWRCSWSVVYRQMLVKPPGRTSLKSSGSDKQL